MLVRESVCLPVNTYQCGSCWMDLCETWFWALPKKSVEFQIWLKSGRNIWHFTWRLKLFHCCWWYWIAI